MEPNADFHGAGFNDLVVNKLKDFVRRQNRLISDLKDQNLKLADKLVGYENFKRVMFRFN